MAQPETVTRETYVRKLPYSVINELSRILDPTDQWKIVADNLCYPPDYTERRYSYRDILVINEVRKHGDSCTSALLQDWGTLNSTTGALVNVLVKCRRYVASDYLCKDILKVDASPRLPGDEAGEETEMLNQLLLTDSTYTNQSSSGGPSEGDDPNPDADLNLPENPTHQRSLPSTHETRYTVFPFKEIEEVTNRFNEKPRNQGGNFIGKGGFGTVFYGIIQPSGEEVAVKRLNNIATVEKQFETEIKTMLRFHHENILMIKGFSSDGPNFCILYEFMKQGSLEDRLACLDGTPALTVMQRVEIAKGTMSGIVYLHTAFDQPMVHRDIKSANILLDTNLEAKVGDFGFARVGGHGNKTSTIVVTDNVIGTGAYMAPEAVQMRDVSVKLDTYSYGVILLELLSGLRAYDANRKESLLRYHIFDNDEDFPPMKWADQSAGTWTEHLVEQIYNIAERCLELEKKKRPAMVDILPDIKKLLLPDE
ncbi:interleukin-1 receptor-associated kinase 4-like [Lineus longissimus]|uniref:interleukin-1 receptor-associated kinase 4-like n=1 Tax=Lineus longissimus TaxID=88925 RepID=UPI002B4ED0A7